jgi:NAD(P)-dependent dehydrogenase (short-subunit alcohol dehydrogenase family)
VTWDLRDRTALITGASQGLGRAIAGAYVKAGCSVLICARDASALEDARREIASLATAGQIVIAERADVSRADDVRRLGAVAEKCFPQLHILVNNAGVYGPKGPIEAVDWEQWVDAIRINLLGSVMLCRTVLPGMKARRYGKIIQLSGGGATAPLPRISAYAASKAAVVRFVETLAEEARADRIDVNSIAPGALNTRLLDEVLTAGPELVGADFYARAVKQKDTGGAPLATGAEAAVFLGSGASDGITGKLLSAVWDPWQELPSHLEDLRRTDVYTLRRIVPKDRGLKWGT